MLDDIDLLIAGAGPAGCVIAERAASLLGWRVLLVDRRPHLAGNCYDSPHDNGVLVHRYGPHYFRTNNVDLMTYLSRFSDWIPARYEVRSLVRGQLFPFPINLDTLEKFFDRRLDPLDAECLLARLREPIADPATSEQLVLSRVGRELYETFYRGYTRKQWGCEPRDLDASVCGRIPVRLDRDGRYVTHRFQVMPKQGFTPLFRCMTAHRRIRLMLGCDFRALRRCVTPRRATLYTGPIDEYFDCRLGKLPYRSLKFDLVSHSRPFVQPCVQINYPNDFAYTRSVEFKHVTGQQHPETVVSYETPSAVGEPFYPVPSPANRALYQRYQELAEHEMRTRHVFFCGRLAQYRYFNMDEVIEEALKCFARIRRMCAASAVPSASSPVSSIASAAGTALALTGG